MKEFEISLLLVEPSDSTREKVTALLHDNVFPKRWDGREILECFLKREAGHSASALINSVLLDPLFGEVWNLSNGGYLRLGVFFDSATCNVELDSAVVAKLQQRDLAVLFTCYPCSDEDPDEPDA